MAEKIHNAAPAAVIKMAMPAASAAKTLTEHLGPGDRRGQGDLQAAAVLLAGDGGRPGLIA